MKARKNNEAQIFAHQTSAHRAMVAVYYYGKCVLRTTCQADEVEGCEYWSAREIYNFVNQNA